MRIVSALFFFLLLDAPLWSQEEPDYRMLIGNVKSVREISYKAKTHYTEPHKGQDSYVTQGRKCREYSSQHDFEIVYDTLGRKTEKLILNRYGKALKHIYYDYDAHGFLIRERTCNRKGKPVDSITYANQYNVSGQLVKRIITYTHRSDPITYWYQHDAAGNIYESVQLGTSLPVKTNNTRRLDKNWNPLVWWTYNNNGKPLEKHIYTYNAQGQMISDSIYGNGWSVLESVYKWRYDDHGNVEQFDACAAAGLNCTSLRYEYYYEKYGNWTSVTEYRNGKATYIRRREFVFYD